MWVQEGYNRIAFRCSPYTTNSAMYPVIEYIQRTLGWQHDDPTETKLDKLEHTLRPTRLPVEEAVPLLAALLSLPVPEDRYPALTFSPQRQRQLTQDMLVTWMLETAECQPVLMVWEDIHWADPSTLELLGLFIEQTPTVPMLNVLAYRPDLVLPWPMQSYMTPLMLNRLERTHIEALVRRLASDKRLPAEVETHIVTRTDGVPLYVEELTKMLLASDLLQEETDQYILTGALSSASIPATLQDSLMARLDRLPEVREVAQLCAVLGREFSYEMVQALAEIDEATLQAGLSQLVTHELLYQRGRIPRATYIFRHVLIRDAAYASLLRNTRQQYHYRIAQTLEERFPATVETQPELVAYHYMKAGCAEASVGYWQGAGQRESDRSSYQEAISHLTTGLTLLQTLPETLSRHQLELPLQTALGAASIMVRGYSAPEVEAAYTRARLLCQALGDTQDVSPLLFGLWRFYNTRADFSIARQLGEELLGLAKRRDESPLYVVAHLTLGATCMQMGELRPARHHFGAGFDHYTPAQQNALMFRAGQDPGVACKAFTGWTLCLLGYPDQATAYIDDALALATKLDHPFSTAFAHDVAAMVYQFRREARGVCDHAEAAVSISAEQGFTLWLSKNTIFQGWVLLTLGQGKEGLTQMHSSFTDCRTSGAEVFVPYLVTLLAEGYCLLNQIDEGLDVLQEGLQVVEQAGEHWAQAEVYRLQGQLLLAQSSDNAVEAESKFHQAISIAQSQCAKSFELRTATSLARLWQFQDKRQEAYDLLAPIYGWFTEGFDTADLKDAQNLLNELEG